MFGTALIVFREVLEAALIVGIVAAATRGIQGRARWIAAGVAAGVFGSLAVAAGAGALSQLAEGMGQELFNATILGVAVAMLAWHNIWMSGRDLRYAKRSKESCFVCRSLCTTSGRSTFDAGHNGRRRLECRGVASSSRLSAIYR